MWTETSDLRAKSGRSSLFPLQGHAVLPKGSEMSPDSEKDDLWIRWSVLSFRMRNAPRKLRVKFASLFSGIISNLIFLENICTLRPFLSVCVTSSSFSTGADAFARMNTTPFAVLTWRHTQISASWKWKIAERGHWEASRGSITVNVASPDRVRDTIYTDEDASTISKSRHNS